MVSRSVRLQYIEKARRACLVVCDLVWRMLLFILLGSLQFVCPTIDLGSQAQSVQDKIFLSTACEQIAARIPVVNVHLTP